MKHFTIGVLCSLVVLLAGAALQPEPKVERPKYEYATLYVYEVFNSAFLNGFPAAAPSLITKERKKFRDYINKHAKDGWRVAHILSEDDTSSYAAPTFIIFERPIP